MLVYNFSNQVTRLYLDLCTNFFFYIDDLVVFYAYEILCPVVELTSYLMEICLIICQLRIVSIAFFCRLVVLDY